MWQEEATRAGMSDTCEGGYGLQRVALQQLLVQLPDLQSDLCDIYNVVLAPSNRLYRKLQLHRAMPAVS
jgi:hypothetical protein